MQAWIIERHGDLDALHLGDIEPLALTSGGLRIRVEAAALNPADDKVLTGRDGGKFLHAQKFPHALGYDFSGEVQEVGEGVTHLAAGDEVFGFLPYSRANRQGSFAELVTVPADTVARKPDGVTHAEAACAATAASTALQGLRDKGRLRADQRVLVNGASGGVGSYAVQIAKLMGADVWGTASASKGEHVGAMGADRVIDYRVTPLADIDETFDVVFDAASSSSFGACSRLLRAGGTYITLLPSLGLLGGFVRSLFTSKRARFVVVQSRRADLAQLATWMTEGALRHPIDSTYGFDDVVKALERQRSGEASGKIAIDRAHGAEAAEAE